MSSDGFTSRLTKRLMSVPRKLFGTRNDRILKGYNRQVPIAGAFETDLRGNFDDAFAKHLETERLDELDEADRPARIREIRIELSKDLSERAENLRSRTTEALSPLDDWWTALKPDQQLEQYYRFEYQKRDVRLMGTLDDLGILPEAFALLREASRRAQDHRHFDCQIIGGRVLYEGKIAEMKTGEGKTIVCHLAAFVRVLSGKKVHVVTVNDYLVKRDAEFAAPIFELIDVSVGHIQAMLDPGGREGLRRQAYDCDITYGTNSEFGFDYLRDNMKTSAAEQVQGRLDFVIVDEVDSILIDEARTPLIISGPAHDDVTRYPRANKVAEELVRRQVVWDRKVLATVKRFDGDAKNIPKLNDAMNILGYHEQQPQSAKGDQAESTTTETDEKVTMATLGPDYITDDQLEAIQIYENDILKMPVSEQYQRYFIVQIERKQVGITHEGVTIAQDLLDMGSLYSGANMEWPHLVENALRAHKVYQRDRDYVVQSGEIIIVDPFTGRLMHGRQWSDGLHQAVEARERVKVKEETQTLATITIQNFIKLYLTKSGMTGTASTEATEFDKIYGLDVVEIPTNRPVNRVDHNDKMYRDTDQKFGAIVDEIHEIHKRGRPADPFLLADALAALKPILSNIGQDTNNVEEALRQFKGAELGDTKVISFMLDAYDEAMGDLSKGRPVLVGTTSVENSEQLSQLLTKRYGIEHEVLNAKNHSREAEIVVKAGQTTLPTHGRDRTPLGNVTIATNMAGRGTDIKLGLNVVYEKCKVASSDSSSELYPLGTTKCCIHCDEYDAATNCAHCFKPKLDPRFPALGRTVCPISVPCGLHIIGTERHEARRIDNQLRGRAGRQGDPGSSRFSLSLQDDLLKMFMSDWMLKMMERLGFTDGGSLEDKRLTKGIERAQRKVEERNYSSRKHLLEWDEPMDFQRKEFYLSRQRILDERDLPGLIFETINDSIDTTVRQYFAPTFVRTCIAEWCHSKLDLSVDVENINDDDLESAQTSIRTKAWDEAQDMIRTSLGEYIDTEEPPNKWDVGGLIQWAQRLFKFSITQNQLRKMDPEDIHDALTSAAQAHYNAINLDGIAIYLSPNYAYSALSEWSRGKFNVEIDEKSLADHSAEEVIELIQERVRSSYREREICYPVEACVDRAFGGESAESMGSAQAVAHWANAKYNVDWTPEQIQGLTPTQVRDQLVLLSREFFGGRLEEEIDKNIDGKSREEAIDWARKRFGPAWHDRHLTDLGDDPRDGLISLGREMLRWELTRLEQFVLLRIYDQAWKDHLLEMDHLKQAIMQRPLGGDQSHPQSQYAIEGRELFTQMWSRISDRVSLIIFKVRFAGEDGEGKAAQTASTSSPANLSMVFRHVDSTGSGFAGATADQRAAMQAQGAEGKVETIRRETARVGRNAPCPCGSGKKFKQCHGKQ